jgi:putative ABC transport system substrate-binding protein
VPVIGFLRSAPLTGAMHLVAGFREGLKEAGFVEGQNVAIQLRSAEGHSDRLPTLVAELNSWPVALVP